MGELAELESVPFVPCGDLDPAAITPEIRDRAEQLARKLSQLWQIVTEGDQYIWFECKVPIYSLETRATFNDLITNCEQAATDLNAEGIYLAEIFGLQPPKSITQGQWLLGLGNLLGEGPGIPPNWLLTNDIDSLVSEAKRYTDLSQRWYSLRKALGEKYIPQFFDLPNFLNEDCKNLLKIVSSLFGRDISRDKTVMSCRGDLLNWIYDLTKRGRDWQRDARILCDLLGLSGDNLSIEHLERLIEIAEFCSKENRPDCSWFDPLQLTELVEALPRIKSDYQARNQDRANLLDDYDISFLTLDFDSLIQDFKIRYASVWRWLKPRFYGFRRCIKQCRHDGKFPESIRQDLEKARNLKRLEAKVESESDVSKKLLGNWYRSYDTNFVGVDEAIGIAQKLLNLVPIRPMPPQIIQQACHGRTPALDLLTITKRLKDSLRVWQEQTGKISHLLPINYLPSTSLQLCQSKLIDVVAWAEQLSEPFRKAINYLEMVQASLRSIEERSPREILSDLDILDSVRDLEKRVKQESQHLKTIFGDRFSGLQTDWSDILAALEWAKRIREHFKTQPISEKFIQKAQAGNRAAPNVIPFKEKIASFQNLFAQFEKHFASGYPQFGKVFLRACTYEIQLSRLAEMKQRVGEIQDWVDYTNLREDFQNCGLSSLFQEIVKRPLKPERLPEIVSKSILQAWTDDIFKKKPALGRFRSQDHEALISEFRELDRKHWEFGAFRVISEANKRKPRGEILVPGGEEKVLLREAYKQKRHLPIRRLFGQIPNLLPRLKPCLLMSPLSVSQFLDPLQTKFDLVIFDEASQIRTEDAVGAIYRGQQLVICGDNRQLPPTAFFEQGMSEEYEDQGVEDPFDVFPSILDECAAIGISQGWLRWHYRSKHESLIAFSNNQFYGNNLVTFPASNIEDPRLGIELRYLSDGTYDRSGKRDNPREAGKVVEIILNHFLTHPESSLGVVAFSIAQMIAIEDRVEKLIRERPEIQNYLKEDRLEGFFVKNLENVQGDERDVMIFSVGYGKDTSGKIDMRMFGPLTRAGGERRLIEDRKSNAMGSASF